MGIFIKNRKLILVLLIVFGFALLLGIEAKAQTVDCDSFNTGTDQDANRKACLATPANRCEWCSMPGMNDAKCRKKLETGWPPSPVPPNLTLSRCSTFADFIKYFYEWGLAIGGVATFLSLVMAGVSYLTSVGKPETMNQAKDRATSAIFGLLLLFGSWIILNTINPELTNFTGEPLDLASINLFECDTDADCVQLYCNKKPAGCNFKCGDPVANGKKEGLCIREEAAEEGKCAFALVFKATNFEGSEMKHIVVDNIADTEFTDPGSVASFSIIDTGRDCPSNCNACGEAGCKARSTQENNYPCYWDNDKCYTNCGEKGCGCFLALFETYDRDTNKCSAGIFPTSAYDTNLGRLSDRPINCIRLSKSAYQ
jgi:hypothetical protein